MTDYSPVRSSAASARTPPGAGTRACAAQVVVVAVSLKNVINHCKIRGASIFDTVVARPLIALHLTILSNKSIKAFFIANISSLASPPPDSK